MGTEAPVLDDNRLIRRGYKVADMNVDIITLNIHTGHRPIFFKKNGDSYRHAKQWPAVPSLLSVDYKLWSCKYR